MKLNEDSTLTKGCLIFMESLFDVCYISTMRGTRFTHVTIVGDKRVV